MMTTGNRKINGIPWLFLQLMVVEDATRVKTLMTDMICNHLGVKPIYSVADAKDFISRKGFAAKKRIAICHSRYGLMGGIGYSIEQSPNLHAVVSFWLGDGFQGKGYGSKALLLLCNRLQRLVLTHFMAQAYAYNIASQRALCKAGFKPIAENNTHEANDVVDFERRVG
ncbi:GNAT family N-acetyltransferase [Spartinivicinus poritis]|uniref:GNAT family N-acetyltransferase n=1 Tax=Spartinivicinus poritis TaxID=2994640 RepID=A0ABT5U789_9GAMM|nr:GNAT family N-acetyltransferase [Spartinivicinus sp. A2-2]MDE1462182.1 GNAT family N-acetyltransferase [Spartinivicinus sp. A2-2]